MKACEGALDRSVEALDLWNLPRRSVLTTLYVVVHNVMHGSYDGLSHAHPAEAEALINRLAYLARFIVRCPPEPMGASASDAASILGTEEMVQQVKEAVLYAHACEFFPEVRKGWYEVAGTDRSFVLDHPAGAVRTAEEKDVLLSEIAIPMRLHPLSPDHPMRTNLLLEPAMTNGRDFLLAKLYYDHFVTLELDLVNDQGMRAIAGVSVQQFRDFQRAIAALASTWLDLAADAGRQAASASTRSGAELWVGEQMEWLAPCISANYIEGMIATLAGLADDEVDRLIKIFTLQEDGRPAGEGFFPPFHYLTHVSGTRFVMFSPDVLLQMTAQRNAVYVFSKTDQKQFDRIVSREMEPRLLEVVQKQFAREPSLVIRTTANWTAGQKAGEFDLLVYDPRANAVCHVQAKAPIPPQGARMVERLEGRVTEGLDQLKRFRSLGAEERDRVLSQILERPIVQPQLHELLITRTSFGTARIWLALGPVVPTNPHLLKGAIDDLLHGSGGFLLPDLMARLGTLLGELVHKAKPDWQSTPVTFGDTQNESQVEVTLPLLKLNHAVIQGARIRFAPF